MNKYDWSKEKVEIAVKNNFCYSDVLRALDIPVKGNNSETLKNKIKEYNIDTSHFTFISSQKGKSQKTSVSNYLKKGSKIKTFSLKLKLIESGLKENKCEICGCTEWLGKPLNCQLHHIDGDNTNNELSNLQMLCPNCHSQTDNYCGSANKTEKEKVYCTVCGREINGRSESGLCVSCAGKKRAQRERGSSIEPSKEELSQLIIEKSFSEIGRMFKVTDNTIRKWCRKHNLPTTKTEMGLINLSVIPIKKCDNCGKEFKPKTRTQRFCSDKCQREFQTNHGGFENSPILKNLISKETLIELHKDLSWSQIAKKFNTTRNCINSLRKQYGIYNYSK